MTDLEQTLIEAIVATPAFARLVTAMKADTAQLLDEIAPATPRSFGELHDHCDANMLGCYDPMFDWIFDATAFGNANVFCGVFNAAQDAVDAWLKAR